MYPFKNNYLYMKRMIKLISIVVLTPVLLFALYVVGNLVYASITKFKPEAVVDVPAFSKAAQSENQIASTDSSLDFLIWNIGYGGLGAEANFFYDGGEMVVSPKEMVEKYNKGIVDFLSKSEADFILLQEADTTGRRSWKINQKENIAAARPNDFYAFAVNYDVQFVPVPYTNPMGRVLGGLLSFSSFTPVENKRIQLPNKDKFPDQLFYLERCLLLQRFKLPNGKDLVVVNTHFEAYDNGEVKAKQMAFTKTILVEEYNKGNYVVMGGDWNISPPGFAAHSFAKEPETDYLDANANANYIEGWNYAFDPSVATNRKNKTAFDAAKTFTTIIDYFLVSPNLEVEEVKGIDLGFKSSDHQPVKLRVRLK